MSSYLEAVDEIVADIVAPSAGAVDRDGEFPRKAVDALGEAGVLGMTCAREVGGGGLGPRAAAEVVERLSAACGTTGMVVLMHYAAVAVIDAHGPAEIRRDVAAGNHLSTLAYSESGSRSHFWAPLGTATCAAPNNPEEPVRLDARKSWVTSAGEADSYLWSSRPLSNEDGMTLWLVPALTPGLTVGPPFDGLGLRGNASMPVTADCVLVPQGVRLGPDGAGLDITLSRALPWFLVLNAAFGIGLMRACFDEAVAHLTATRLDHLGITLAEEPTVRLDIARMRLAMDGARALLDDTLAALETGREDATLRVLEVKAQAAEAAITVTDLAMKTCGGAAFRKEVGIERRFRDARAARVMAPTTDALLGFVGRVTCGQPLLDGMPS